MRQYLEDEHLRDKIQFDFGDLAMQYALAGDMRPMPELLQRISRDPLFGLGRRDTGSGMHFHEENWVAQIRGRKVWIIAPPATRGLRAEELPCGLLAPERVAELPAGVLACEAVPGDVFYLPGQWNHATCN